MQSRVTVRQVAVAGAPRRTLHETACADAHDRPDSAAIDGAAFEVHDEKVAAVATIVAEDGRRAIEVVDDDVQVSEPAVSRGSATGDLDNDGDGLCGKPDRDHRRLPRRRMDPRQSRGET